MKSPGDPHGERLWSIVAATVRPFPGRERPRPKPSPAPIVAAAGVVSRTSQPPTGPRASSTSARVAAAHPPLTPRPLEPGRHRRLIRGREPPAAIVDLHGLDQDRARAALGAFVLRAHAEGRRTVLVITGKGALGDGVLRRRTPEWLGEPPLRGLVAGMSEAHRRHGGEGALYVALKRQERR